MDINIRKVDAYSNVVVEIDGVTVDMGLLNSSETLELAQTLLDSASTLLELGRKLK